MLGQYWESRLLLGKILPEWFLNDARPLELRVASDRADSSHPRLGALRARRRLAHSGAGRKAYQLPHCLWPLVSPARLQLCWPESTWGHWSETITQDTGLRSSSQCLLPVPAGGTRAGEGPGGKSRGQWRAAGTVRTGARRTRVGDRSRPRGRSRTPPPRSV